MQRGRGRRDGIVDDGGNGGGGADDSRDAGGVFPVTGYAPSRSVRILSVGFGEHGKLGRPCPLRPPPSFIVQCDGGPPTIVGWAVGWAPPIRARVGRQSLTLRLG